MSGNVCHIEEVGFTFGSGHEHLMTANRAIIVRDCFGIKIKMDNRGASSVHRRNQHGGFVVGGCNDARSTGRIGRRYRFTVENGWIWIDFKQEVKEAER